MTLNKLIEEILRTGNLSSYASNVAWRKIMDFNKEKFEKFENSLRELMAEAKESGKVNFLNDGERGVLIKFSKGSRLTYDAFKKVVDYTLRHDQEKLRNLIIDYLKDIVKEY